MKVLITGANGYIGMRLLPVLLEKNHDIVCLVRDKRRFKERSGFGDQVKIITGDLLKETSIEAIPQDIDAAYYLVHSVAETPEFSKMEALSAHNFVQALNHTRCKQIVFLSGIVNDSEPSPHHTSREHIEDILRAANAALTVLCASVIIGRGSPLFEIIRTMTEKLLVTVAPRWVKTRCQPIALHDVLAYLEGVLLNEKTFNQTFDIGGPDILSFKKLMLAYAKACKPNRKIIVLPFLSPRLSSYWLYFVTSGNYPLARSLVDGMKNETIMHDHRIDEVVPRQCLTYQEALGFCLCDEIIN
jgi:uncharacterized protein YbjT (DUF2867 family)